MVRGVARRRNVGVSQKRHRHGDDSPVRPMGSCSKTQLSSSRCSRLRTELGQEESERHEARRGDKGAREEERGMNPSQDPRSAGKQAERGNTIYCSVTTIPRSAQKQPWRGNLACVPSPASAVFWPSSLLSDGAVLSEKGCRRERSWPGCGSRDYGTAPLRSTNLVTARNCASSAGDMGPVDGAGQRLLDGSGVEVGREGRDADGQVGEGTGQGSAAGVVLCHPMVRGNTRVLSYGPDGVEGSLLRGGDWNCRGLNAIVSFTCKGRESV